MKKIIIGGIFAGVVLMAVGFVFGSLTADLYMMSPSSMWKPMNFNLLIIYDVIVGLILAYAYSILKASVPGSGIKKGLIFGLIIFLVGMVPGLGITWVTMNIRNKLILMWALSGVIQYMLAGIAVQFVDEKI